MCDCNRGMGMTIAPSGPVHLGIGGLGDIFSDFVDSPAYAQSVALNPATAYTPGVDWGSILNKWTDAGVSIAKAAGGANPSYQQVTPQGSVTVYGQGSGFPVTTSLMTSNASSYIIPVGIAIVAVMALSKAFK